MSYEIAPLKRVRTDFPEFRATLLAVQNDLIARAQQIWSGYTFGGISPSAGQFGLANIAPRHMSIPRGFGTWSFIQAFTTPGSWVNIFSYTVPSNQIHGYAGFGFYAPDLIFNALRIQVSDTIYPIIEIEEAQGYFNSQDGMALILKSDAGEEYIVPELVAMQMKGWQERRTSGWNIRTVPIGQMAFKARDDMITLSSPAV